MNTQKTDFVHLHVHTEYSLLDGSSKIEELIKKCKALGMNSLAITDHGVMYGVVDFYKAARANGVKPILGCEVYVTPGSRLDRELVSGEDRYHHMVLLAENNIGYQNLIKIVSIGFTEGFYYKPRIDKEVLLKYHEGIIALSACLAGEIPSHIVRGQYGQAKEAALFWQDTFGEGNFYLELQDHGIPEQRMANQGLQRISHETGIGLVCTNDIHYTYETDVEPHDILLCIQTGKFVNDEDRMRYEGGQYYCKSPEEMKNLFPSASEALDNTVKIAERCHVELEFGVPKLPEYPVPQDYTAYEYLKRLCNEGIENRYEEVTEEIRSRLNYELDTIHSMGYVDYFLIVWDFIKFARDESISVGPGRGSAAGSIVAYALQITNIDPLKYNLIFERFLNPERISMPDIDTDFCYEHRQDVIDYVVDKYGKENVAQIVTFGTMGAKAVVRDVGRVIEMPYSKVDQIAKMIPYELGMTLEKALKSSSDLRAIYETDNDVKYLIDMSLRLEGLPRHTSMHAAGVVICKEAVSEYVPLSKGADNSVTTQFTMTTLEELGLLKMDFLGLRTLTVIQDAIKQIHFSKGIDIDIDTIDMNDPRVYELISSGKCDGVFQLESAGMKSFMKDLRPESLGDIIAGISLYRPGPMDSIPKYVEGKRNNASIQYDCPELEEILKPTYGCIVYQEQVMQIVRDLAGYTWGRSDLVRRAMSKKKVSVMEQERHHFVYGNEGEGVDGCLKRGIDEQVANHIFDEMYDFAKYAFNKSHAAGYAVIAYQTAYLKRYYPVEFMAALMTSVTDHSSKLSEYMMITRQMNIKLLPPNVNEGFGTFSVSDDSIIYSLSAIKGVGRNVIENMIAERNAKGKFRDLNDFIKRTSQFTNKRLIENFIKAGAFDCFGKTRKQMVQVYPNIVDDITQTQRNEISGQMTLFDFADEEMKEQYQVRYPDIGEYDNEVMLAFEKEVLGIYISGHPLEEFDRLWRNTVTAMTIDFIFDEEIGASKVRDQEQKIIGGMITHKTLKNTRSGHVMAFLTIEDVVGTAEVIVFPRQYEIYRNRLEEDAKIFVMGRATATEDQDSKLICERLTEFQNVNQEVWIQFANQNEYTESEKDMKCILEAHPGHDIVKVYVRDDKRVISLGEAYKVRSERPLLDVLTARFGQDNIKVLQKSIEKQLKMN